MLGANTALIRSVPAKGTGKGGGGVDILEPQSWPKT